MSHSVELTDGLRAGLQRQLAYLSDNRSRWFDKPPSGTQPEQRELMQTLQLYEERIQRILSGLVDDLQESRVLIGSEVGIRFEDDEMEETYRIVLPDEADADGNRISCLSPLGRSLLLARHDDTVDIRTPQGGYRVRIVRNDYVFAQDDEESKR